MIITHRVKDKGKTVGYIIKDVSTCRRSYLTVKDAKKIEGLIDNAYISNGFYVRRSGYPKIIDIGIKEITRVTHANTKSIKNNNDSRKRSKKSDSKAGISKNKQRNTNNKIEQSSKQERKSSTLAVCGNEGNKAASNNICINKEVPAVTAKLPDTVSGSEIKINYRGKQYINDCKRIRNAARQGRVEMDVDEEHFSNNGFNVQLFKIVQLCGYKDILDFAKVYLAHLQPYALKPFKEEVAKDIKGSVWVSEMGYKVSIIIKVQKKDGLDIDVISLHESNKLGTAVVEHEKIGYDEACGVITDSVIDIGGRYAVKYHIMHGMIVHEFSMDVTRYYCNSVAVVKFGSIQEQYEWYLEDILKAILNKYADMFIQDTGDIIINKGEDSYRYNIGTLGKLKMTDFTMMAYGFKSVNYICFMIDLYTIVNTKDKKLVCGLADGAIRMMGSSERKDLADALMQRSITAHNKLHYEIVGLCVGGEERARLYKLLEAKKVQRGRKNKGTGCNR